jgi:hypothetical protein
MFDHIHDRVYEARWKIKNLAFESSILRSSGLLKLRDQRFGKKPGTAQKRPTFAYITKLWSRDFNNTAWPIWMIPTPIYFYFSSSFINPVVDMVKQSHDRAAIRTYATGELVFRDMLQKTLSRGSALNSLKLFSSHNSRIDPDVKVNFFMGAN